MKVTDKNDNTSLTILSNKLIEDEHDMKLEVFRRRWAVLAITTTTIFYRGFYQACFGIINNVLSEYLNVAPWQVDWFVVSTSAVFITVALPFSWISLRVNYRNLVLFMTLSLTISCILTAVGISMRTGYPIMIIGQSIMGFSNVLSWSIPPATAAIWFPTKEVATVVGIQVLGRGLGEAIGSLLPSLLVNIDTPNEEIGFRLTIMFSVFAGFSTIIAASSFFVVLDAPPRPPSEAQANIVRIRKCSLANDDQSLSASLREYWQSVKCLLTNSRFVAVWFVFGTIIPLLRHFTILLTSIVHAAFPYVDDLDRKVGWALMASWMLYTIGGLAIGPYITKTKRFKTIVLISVIIETIAGTTVAIGVGLKNLDAIYSGVVLLGFFLGTANTALFEYFIEISYPVPTTLVSIICTFGIGIFRLLYPIVGRFLLSNSGPVPAAAIPAVMALLATIIMAIMTPNYNRTNVDDRAPLIEK